MIYKAMKGLIEGLIKTYKCEGCSSKIDEENIDIVGAAGNTLNLDIKCPKCKKHGIIKSQVLMMDLNMLTQVKKSIGNIKNKINNSENQITDSEILDLRNDLKNKKINASDLFN